MAQVERSSSYFHKGREVGILSPKQNRGCFDGGSSESSHDIGFMRKRRFSEENEEFSNNGNFCFNGRPKRFRCKGYFSFGNGNNARDHNPNEGRLLVNEYEEIDKPIHSTRFLEESIRQIQEECNSQFILKENELRSSFENIINDHNQTKDENRILKRAINIQSNRCKELEIQLKDSHEREACTSAYAKRLEQENYMLGLRVRQMGLNSEKSETDFVERRPPDVF